MTEHAACPVVLLGETPSGLAEMLAQYLEQSFEVAPRKANRARRLRGALVVRAAEDDAVAVRLAFTGERVELCDEPGASPAPSIRADFLSLAHVATGEENPLWLVGRGRVRLRCSAAALPFMLAVLGLLRIEEPGAPRARGPWLAAAAVVGAAALGLAFCGGVIP